MELPSGPLSPDLVVVFVSGVSGSQTSLSAAPRRTARSKLAGMLIRSLAAQRSSSAGRRWRSVRLVHARGLASSLSDAQALLDFDRKHVLHPYTSPTNPTPVFPVRSAKGTTITLQDGTKLVDGMSSWWAAVHGYAHPVLDAAITEQLASGAHIMFGGLTHRPAVELSKLLLDVAPPGLSKVFLCDSGSVSVEVAIKMALQFWFRMHETQRTRLLTIRGGYHGDTIGAMSVCDPVNGMHEMFSHILVKNSFVPHPTCAFPGSSLLPPEESGGAPTCEANASRQCGECHCARDLEAALRQDAQGKRELAAVILEPIVQGAGGMRFYPACYLKQVRQMCDEHGVLLIADEIATGFGRTGKLFGVSHAGITPDIMCLGKALSGGYMTLAATLTTDRVAEGIARDGGVLNHGPTFMGNPLACAVALASVRLLLDSPWEARVATVEQGLKDEMRPLTEFTDSVVRDVRVLGAIGVCELQEPAGVTVQRQLVTELGVWLRPFGRLLYTMPCFNAPVDVLDDVRKIGAAMREVVHRLKANTNR